MIVAAYVFMAIGFFILGLISGVILSADSIDNALSEETRLEVINQMREYKENERKK